MCRAVDAIGDRRPIYLRRRGVTLVELMFALAITGIIAGTFGVLASTVRQNSEFNAGQSTALQHARVVLGRIQRYVAEAYATETYPGVVVVAGVVGSYRFPDVLAIWHPPGGAPANAAGPPLVRELVFIAPDPDDPSRLVEITAPGNSGTIQFNDAALNSSSGRSAVTSILSAGSSVKALLTPLVRTAVPPGGASGSTRACIRFECELHPTASEMSAYRGGTTTWTALAWPQGLYSSQTGLRQVWLRSELQLMSQERSADGAWPATATAIPFFGSATLYYQLTP